MGAATHMDRRARAVGVPGKMQAYCVGSLLQLMRTSSHVRMNCTRNGQARGPPLSVYRKQLPYYRDRLIHDLLSAFGAGDGDGGHCAVTAALDGAGG